MTLKQRRRPTQARARATRDAIVTAAAHVLEENGQSSFTTNTVAQRAGVSIGSLYQYFGHKDDILVAIAKRAEGQLPTQDLLIAHSCSEQLSPLRLGIRNYIKMLPDNPIARSQALEAVLKRRGPDGVARQIDRQFKQSGLCRGLSDTERFVLSRAITGVVQSAVREEYSEINSQSFEDALVALARGFLKIQTEI